MSFSTSGPFPVLISDGGIAAVGVPRTWFYQSSDSSTSIVAAGYFQGMGSGSPGGRAVPVGMSINDILINVESTAGLSAYRITQHVVSNSTANFSGTGSSLGSSAAFDVTCRATSS